MALPVTSTSIGPHPNVLSRIRYFPGSVGLAVVQWEFVIDVFHTIGIVVGTYSSIYIASPVVLVLAQRGRKSTAAARA